MSASLSYFYMSGAKKPQLLPGAHHIWFAQAKTILPHPSSFSNESREPFNRGLGEQNAGGGNGGLKGTDGSVMKMQVLILFLSLCDCSPPNTEHCDFRFTTEVANFVYFLCSCHFPNNCLFFPFGDFVCPPQSSCLVLPVYGLRTHRLLSISAKCSL